MKKMNLDELGRLALDSAKNESILRSGKYGSIAELSWIYDQYMELRLEMLEPLNQPMHDGSFKTYDCTLDLITTLMGSLQSLKGSEKRKRWMLKTFQSDYEKVERLKEEFRKKLAEYKIIV